MVNTSPLFITYLKLVGAAVLWGGTFIAGRVVSQDIDPYSAAFFRFAIASIFLLPLTRYSEGSFPVPPKKQYLPLILLGFLLLDEELTSSLFLGGLCVCVGVYLMNKRGRV